LPAGGGWGGGVSGRSGDRRLITWNQKGDIEVEGNIGNNMATLVGFIHVISLCLYYVMQQLN
jgi:hypothetical protein